MIYIETFATILHATYGFQYFHRMFGRVEVVQYVPRNASCAVLDKVSHGIGPGPPTKLITPYPVIINFQYSGEKYKNKFHYNGSYD